MGAFGFFGRPYQTDAVSKTASVWAKIGECTHYPCQPWIYDKNELD